ncbi:Conserved hypothetical protein probably involved in assimilatory sulfate reduction [Winogradskyella psychrotolerans RS-3]|uniref:DUF2061 domain-containing protein n=1 Tax=Winogradskyella psychrotolerans RS-3 TaxID=641526 RepID=S7X0W4_9FLAO|nr:DUF2061 domain-containing protein [Winogradskyella psychrotolerans]EPR72649.1 Conserved hypothetical protein probably involved in assimilatory sulfate reduction [Winogradskyella psychrotolerans RS-3]
MDRVLQADLSLENDKQESNSTQENIKRSIVKTVSWRVVGTLATVTISYLVTGTLALAFSIGGIELVSKMVLYFFHERTWNSIKWGK